MKKLVAYVLILCGIILMITLLYANSRVGQQTRIFSSYTLLSSSWEAYKNRFINADGRVIAYDQNNITTSEGQSYSLLRAIWMDDKTTFDKVWRWTKNNLQKRGDHLFGWKWGSNTQGAYGFMANGGNNPAADADQDIALALIFAGNRWHDSTYTNEAKPILTDIWNEETATAAGNRYLIAGNWAKNQTQIVINPSYFSPYAWRIFAKVDKLHDWNQLVLPAYDLLNQSSDAILDHPTTDHLPPDWILVQRRSGATTATQLNGLTTNYSYDAMRIPWRIGLDYLWNKEPQAKNYLQTHFQLLLQTYDKTGRLPTSIAHNGSILDIQETPAMYSTSLGYFMLTNPKDADRIYQEKIIKLYSNDTNAFNTNLSYYDQNWLWFGAAMYNKYIKPL